MSTTRPALAATDTFAPDVQRFCVEHNLAPHLQEALRIAEAVLQPVRPPVVELDVDPETGDEWLYISVPVAGTVDDVVRRKLAYTAQWVDAAPWDKREKIRLMPAIVEM